MYNIKGTSKKVTKTNAVCLFAAHSVDSVKGSGKGSVFPKAVFFQDTAFSNCTILHYYSTSYQFCKY